MSTHFDIITSHPDSMSQFPFDTSKSMYPPGSPAAPIGKWSEKGRPVARRLSVLTSNNDTFIIMNIPGDRVTNIRKLSIISDQPSDQYWTVTVSTKIDTFRTNVQLLKVSVQRGTHDISLPVTIHEGPLQVQFMPEGVPMKARLYIEYDAEILS